MAAIDNITELAQNVYYSLNGSKNTSTGAQLTVFQDNFILAANLFLDELDTEAYWNSLRVNDYVLGQVPNTTTFEYTLPDIYRTPVFNEYKEVKFVKDGSVIARFALVDPNQVKQDTTYEYNPNRASFLGRKIILSRNPKDTEVTADIVLDVVQYFPKLTRADDSLIALLPSKQLLTLGVAKNEALGAITKRALVPTFTQKYANELQKLIAQNDATNEAYDMQGTDWGFVRGIF